MNSPAPATGLQKPQIYKRRELTKVVAIEVLSQDNKKVIQRWRFVPPTENRKPGQTLRFTPADVERVLENFIFSFDRDNPDHRYRLVQCRNKFRLVWIPEEQNLSTAEDAKDAEVPKEQNLSTAKVAKDAEVTKEHADYLTVAEMKQGIHAAWCKCRECVPL